MDNQRYQLSRWGSTGFEVVDTQWPHCARQVLIMRNVSLDEARAVVAQMNAECCNKPMRPISQDKNILRCIVCGALRAVLPVKVAA